MEKNIILIGFMGTGKSSVGLKLAQKLKMKFVDMDQQIEQITHMSVSEIFKRHGETRFRSEEKLLARKLAGQSNLLIATGGGTALDEENLRLLRSNGVIVCLHASPEEILERVNRRKGTRPLLKKNVSIEDIKEMLKAREKYYAQADYHVSTSGKSTEEVSQEIMKLLAGK